MQKQKKGKTFCFYPPAFLGFLRSSQIFSVANGSDFLSVFAALRDTKWIFCYKSSHEKDHLQQ